jgi:outer membrane receptor protein involved in Fe transport
VIWSGLPSEGIEGATIVRGAGAGPYGAGALTGVVALQERGTVDGLAAGEVSGGERDSYRLVAVGGGPGVLVTPSDPRPTATTLCAARGAARPTRS